jgi:hypothetical protein
LRTTGVARLALFRAVLRELDILKQSSAFSEELLEHTVLLFNRRILALQDNLNGSSPVVSEEKDIRKLTRKVLEAQRGELERLRQEATIHDEVFFQLNLELDIEDARLRAQLI